MIEVSLFGGADVASVDGVVARLREARDAGIGTVWFPQTANLDILTALAAAAPKVPDVRIATGVVPIQGRHPVPLALSALTVVDAAGPGRFTLGLGVSHPDVSDRWFGVPYRGVVDLCEEELTILDTLLAAGRSADARGRHVSATITLGTAAPRPGLVLAALGPRMLRIAGRLTDGTVTWMTGPRTIARHVAPVLRDAAAAAGRPDPRVVVGLPVVVTDDEPGVRARLAGELAPTARRPSYARALAAERVADAGAIGLVGTEEAVAAQLDELAAAGATEVLANPLGPAERARTVAFLGRWAARQGGTGFTPRSRPDV